MLLPQNAQFFSNLLDYLFGQPFQRYSGKIVYDQLSSYLKENKLMFNHQCGSKHSTDFAALELIDRIITDIWKDPN